MTTKVLVAALAAIVSVQVSAKEYDSLPDAGMKDAKVEEAMKKAVLAHDAAGKPLKAVITSDEWSTERNDLGVVRKRTIRGAVSLRRDDGTCYYVTALFAQRFDGTQFGKLFVDAGWGPNDSGVLNELKCPK